MDISEHCCGGCKQAQCIQLIWIAHFGAKGKSINAFRSLLTTENVNTERAFS